MVNINSTTPGRVRERGKKGEGLYSEKTAKAAGEGPTPLPTLRYSAARNDLLEARVRLLDLLARVDVE